MFLNNSIKAAIIVSALLSAATSASLLPSEDLIGEELVTSANVNAYADRSFAETARILSSGGWLPIPNFSGVTNQYKFVSGVYSWSGVFVTRAKATVNVPAQTLFDYLITPTGYQLIDPYSTPEDFSKPPLEEFTTDKWRVASGSGGTKRLEAVRTSSSVIPLIREREFVVLNAIDGGSRTFVSKSIQHAGDPGCSLYGGSSCFNASAVPVRALNSFAVQINPLPTNTSQSVVQLVNYADFTGPEIPAIAQNVINFVFLPDMIGRMRAAFP